MKRLLALLGLTVCLKKSTFTGRSKTTLATHSPLGEERALTEMESSAARKKFKAEAY
ncbi:MAG: hypothetical protein ACLFQR_06220 [Desulfovibrionales bacterium]